MKQLLLLLLVVSSIVGINSYTPSILSAFSPDGDDWVYKEVYFSSGKVKEANYVPLEAGELLLGSLSHPYSNGDSLVLANVGGKFSILHYYVQSNTFAPLYSVNNSINYYDNYDTIAEYSYDKNTNIVYFSTLYPGVSETLLGVVILNFETGAADILQLAVSQGYVESSIVSTYNSQENLHYTYYLDLNGYQHLITFNSATNQSFDTELDIPRSPLATPVTQIFYYDGYVYVCNLYNEDGVTIIKVDVTTTYDIEIYYTNSDIQYSNTVVPFVFDDNGWISILSPTANKQLNYWMINIQSKIMISGTSPTYQILPNTWIVDTL